MLYSKVNYLLMLLSLCLIIGGFILMSGGGSTDPNVFNEAIFSASRTRVAPIICVAGFALMGYAILYRSKDNKSNPAQKDLK